MSKQEKKRELLEVMMKGEVLSDLIGENGNYKLKKGKNIIKVIDGTKERKKVIIHTGDDSIVQKDMQDETDIKNILKKYGRTGVLPIMQDEALYGDFSSVPDFQEAQNIIIRAEQQFNMLDSDLRKKFDNSPEKFLQFCTDEKNLEEMRELGLAKKVIKSPVQQVEVVNQQKEGEK